MNKVELNKMVVDSALGNLQDKLHHIIDGIASAKEFDQYNAKCGEVDRLRELVQAAYQEGFDDAWPIADDQETL